MALLPSFFVLKSGEKYLSVRENESESSNLPPGFLKFNEEEIWSPRVKFAVEPAETGGGALVHIRSCYNNKYLVMEQFRNNLWIVASAKKTEEDRTKASCTLFEPHSLSELTSIRLRHAQTRVYATHMLSPDGDTQQGMLISSSSVGSAFRAIDSKSVTVLPSIVSFKKDDKAAKYLCSRKIRSLPWQAGANANWIWADAGPDNYSNETLFSVIKLDDNVIALKNLENNSLCGPLSAENESNCMNAHYPTLTNQTRLVIEEVILQRTISKLKYRLSNSRIYGEHIIECDHAFATNDSPDEKTTVCVNFSFTNSKTSSWSNALSIKCGSKIGFEIEKIPCIVSGKVELSNEVGNTNVWGGSVVDTCTRGSTYSVPVPKLTTMKVTMLCTKASCDVPFSYTQTDLLPSGMTVSTRKDDGLFTGINSYNVHYKSKVVPN
uniref:uncharacterized protein LOC122583510 n=1 Tax=Erigeron canadensis TaxID=72917 RepID=UPI001CB8CFFB|nr:uncharacterized protein LOC122583510 [Erigeron canadensis]